MFHLISFWLPSALLSSSRQRLAAQQLASLSARAGLSKSWPRASAGGFLSGVCVCFLNWEEVEGIPASSCLAPKPPYSFQMLSWKRACSENWQIIVQWPGGNDQCSSFIMQILRCLQKCGKLKMMAVVRTSLQKVVVLLHRLQRMAVSSPRYQKLCKVTEWLKMRISGVWQFYCFSGSKI